MSRDVVAVLRASRKSLYADVRADITITSRPPYSASWVRVNMYRPLAMAVVLRVQGRHQSVATGVR